MTSRRRIARLAPPSRSPSAAIDEEAPDSRVRERPSRRPDTTTSIAVVDHDDARREALLSALHALGHRAVAVVDYEALLLLDERVDVVVGEVEGIDVGRMLHALASFAPTPALVARVVHGRDATERVLRHARVARMQIVDAATDPTRIAEIVRTLTRSETSP